MSTLFNVQIPCDGCGARVVVRVADSLNANRMPEARTWVLERTLFRERCTCGAHVLAIHPFLYADFDRGLWIHVMSEDQRPHYHAREPEVLAAHRAAFDTATGPRFLDALGAMVTPRLVYGYEELREKLIAADERLDDALVEAMKLEILVSRPELIRQGVMLLTLDSTDEASLRFRAHHFRPTGAPADREVHHVIGSVLGEIAVSRALYAALAEKRDAVRDSYPSLFDGVYVNVQRYRFEPAPPAPEPINA